MKNHLAERIISGIWFGILAYFFIDNLTLFSPPWKPVASIILSIVYVLFGFFRGYKNLLLPSDDLNTFPFHCVAGVWSGALACFIIMFINSLLNDKYLPTTSPHFLIIIGLISFLIGYRYFYRLLLLPKTIYLKTFPSVWQRIMAATWFGIIGYLLALGLIRNEPSTIPIFVLLLTSYLGYVYGYRILLLPSSIKGALKSIIIGFIGNSYALFIVMLIYSFNMFSGSFASIRLLGDSSAASFVMIFIITPIASLFISAIGTIFSLILYLLSRPWAK